jgi:hypothetical protein
MGIIKGLRKEKKYIVEVINDKWIRLYLIINDKKQFIGAENPNKIYNNLLQYYSDWPEGSKCIIVFSETHDCLYGKRINNEETEILLQDRNTNVILKKVMKKNELHKSIVEFKEYTKGINDGNIK